MAITTTYAHVNMALYLKSKISSTYLGIGKSSEWDDENNPPEPTPDRQELDEPIGYKRVNNVSLCRRLPQGEEPTREMNTIDYLGRTYELIADENAHEVGATYVYFEAEIRGEELPAGEYRQVGIFTDLVPEEGITKNNLLPDEVEDTGTLEFYDNRQKMSRLPETNLVERFIVNTQVT